MMFKITLESPCAVLLTFTLLNQIVIILNVNFLFLFLSFLLSYDDILLVGDFDIYVDDPNNYCALS